MSNPSLPRGEGLAPWPESDLPSVGWSPAWPGPEVPSADWCGKDSENGWGAYLEHLDFSIFQDMSIHFKDILRAWFKYIRLTIKLVTITQKCEPNSQPPAAASSTSRSDSVNAGGSAKGSKRFICTRAVKSQDSGMNEKWCIEGSDIEILAILTAWSTWIQFVVWAPCFDS